MTFKSFVRRMLPDSARKLLWRMTDPEYRRKWNATRQLRLMQRRAAKLIALRTGGIVASGPFAGIRYPTDGRYPQKLLGTYELELHETLNEIARSDFEVVIDIGAAEGYYVCGLARMLPNSRVVAFEADETLHPLIHEQLLRNEVDDRVDLRGLCRTDDLASVLLKPAGRVLIVCDIEGAEDSVLDPTRIPQLNKADILVEVHDHLCKGVSSRLQGRFSHTHTIERIVSRPRNEADLPKSILLPSELVLASMDELRHPANQWFWLRAASVR